MAKEMTAFKNVVGLLALISVATALLLLIWPDRFKRINNYLKKWFSTRRLIKPLEMQKDIDEQIFKMRNLIGTLLLVLAVFFVYMYIKL